MVFVSPMKLFCKDLRGGAETNTHLKILLVSPFAGLRHSEIRAFLILMSLASRWASVILTRL